MADNSVQSPPVSSLATGSFPSKNEKTEYDITALSTINACQLAMIASVPIWGLIGYILLG